MQSEILRIVEALHRERDIDKEIIFQGIESAILLASRKKYKNIAEINVSIDRTTGEIILTNQDGEKLTPPDLGRVAAQAGKQVITQKIRKAEQDTIYNEFITKKRTILTGLVHHYENNSIIVTIGKAEGILSDQEQIRGEQYQPGDRIRAYLLDVKKMGSRVKILLSRTHPNFIRKLFELEIPEIEQGFIQINQLVREPGYRTKIAVSSQDKKIDCVGACIGVRGARIRNILEELGSERVDIIRWDDSPEVLIKNSLKPAEISSIALDHAAKRAKVFVDESQQALAIGKEGQNVRLAAKLCKWDIDITTQKPENIDTPEQNSRIEDGNGSS
ncbi:MAG: transcription termination factor NusA [Candidatus Brocadiae bacterium]|nr:transcription termination factor NusA [Candidatus Brocadiia bacterium]